MEIALEGVGHPRQGRSFSLILLPLLVTSLGSCGPRRHESRRPANNILPIVMGHDTPASYELFDQQCQRSTTPVELTKAEVSRWNGPKVIPSPLIFRETISQKSLTSASISRTSYGDQFARVCNLNKPQANACEDEQGSELSWRLESSYGPLRICTNDSHYPRLSYEGVALTSAQGIDEARRRYIEVDPKATPPKPVLLSILPNFVDYYDNFVQDGEKKRLKTYITHNLAYFPQGQLIAVFPESARKSQDAEGFLWESAFVLAHEYGHHIDFTRHGTTYEDMGILWQPLSHEYRDRTDLLAGGGQDFDPSATKGSRSLMASAVAEAFADLLAYYTENSSNLSILGLKDIGHNRDIGQPNFANGREKILDDAAVQDFFAPLEDSLNAEHNIELANASPPPLITDVHTMGAVIAHGLNQIVTVLTEASPLVTDGRTINNVKYQLILIWMDQFTSKLAALSPHSTSDEILRTISQSIEITSQKFLQSFALRASVSVEKVYGSLCETAISSFPALPDPLFGRPCGAAFR